MASKRQHLNAPIPPSWTPETIAAFQSLLGQVENREEELRDVAGSALVRDELARTVLRLAKRLCEPDRLSFEAASLVLLDLAVQGWSVRLKGDLELIPPATAGDLTAEKDRVRQQELVKRAERLREAPVRAFVKSMESRRLYGDRFVSIFSVMRDGSALAAALRAKRTDAASSDMSGIIDPYVAVVTEGITCPETGMLLSDIWRYFRLTWSNQYSSTPGRSLAFIVRDRAEAFHPVIGIGALGSAVMQIAARDEWIGWNTERVVASLRDNVSDREYAWLLSIISDGIEEVYLDDLIADGVVRPAELVEPSSEVVRRLREEAKACRAEHGKVGRKARAATSLRDEGDFWRKQALTPLFRSKRCELLAELLEARRVFALCGANSSAAAMQQALLDRRVAAVVARLVRRARAERVGTAIADITVCGAVAPYNHLLGGKLVAMLCASTELVGAYRERYERAESEIASSLAGRGVVRPADLVFLGTTSLYGSGSSQYNRLRMPATFVGGPETGVISYERLGYSKSYGTSHFGEDTVARLGEIADDGLGGRRINHLFGEGTSPKLRRVRTGLEALGWPSNELLMHGRRRIVYGVNLITNLRDYLLGVDPQPSYIGARDGESVAAITRWWVQRWLTRRIESDEVLERVESDVLTYPVSHGARVQMPDTGDLTLFDQEE